MERWVGSLSSLTCILLLFLFACSLDNAVQPETGFAPELSDLIAPAVVYNASPAKHVVSVTVRDPQGLADVADVSYTLARASDGTVVLQGDMVDDGSQGDIIPRDGVFAAQIQGSFAAGETGEFQLSVVGKDKEGNESNVLEARIFVQAGQENLPPEIVNVTVPETVAADSSFDFVVTAEVTDPDGPQDVQRVIYQFFPPTHPTPTQEDTLVDDGTGADAVAGDGVYTAVLSSNLIRTASDYFLRFQAEDRAGSKSAARIATIRGVFRLPQAPVLSNLVAPDTVQIDPTRVVQILLTVDVFDPQGLSDIDFVRFRSFLPNGQEAKDSPFELSDDGNRAVSGDEVAGDGTYSIIVNLPPNGVTPGDFRFVFQAKDKSGLLSNTIEHIMTVIQ